MLKITLISCLEEDRRIIAVGSLRPPGGGKTVHGASSTEEGQSMQDKNEIGSCLVPVAQSREVCSLVLLALARARRKAAFDTQCRKIPEENEAIVTDRCLRQ